MLRDESLTLTLGDYIRGHGLTFASDNITSARVANPLNLVGSVQFGFEKGYTIINSDIISSNDKKWFHSSVVLAQKDTKNIGIAVTRLTGTRNIQPLV